MMQVLPILFIAAMLHSQCANAEFPKEGSDPRILPDLLQVIQSDTQMRPPKARCSPIPKVAKSGKCSIYMQPDRLISRCLKGRTQIPARRISRSDSYACRSVLGVTFTDKLRSNYELSVVDGRPHIVQRVRFYGFPDSSSEDYFRGMLTMNLDRIERFFGQQGIHYKLDFKTTRDPKDPVSQKRSRISIDFTNRRSSQDHWHLGYELKERLKFANLSKGSVHRNADNEFVYVVIHELLHGMGLHDDYYSEGESCPEIYEKRNSHRPAYVPCPKDPDVICGNIMSERSTEKNGALPIESIYQLLEPLCPDECDYSDVIFHPWQVESPRVRHMPQEGNR